MTLPASPPAQSAPHYTVRPGDSGWFVYAVQVAYAELGYTVAADGTYGSQTTAAAKAFQAQKALYPDGVTGPVTQSRMVAALGSVVEANRSWLAVGYVRGITQTETSGIITVVNWSIPGGVDCGAVQRRVLGPPFDAAALRNAFDTRLQLTRIAEEWQTRRNAFLQLAWAHDNYERAGRCAALAHNWPDGAEQMAKNGTVDNPRQKATWIPRDENGISLVHFPDGTLVDTRGQWCEFYVGFAERHGPGMVGRYVTDWR
jgi:peptidoglycan hydrolase-like protein with peptidoglycan-binding domain